MIGDTVENEGLAGEAVAEREIMLGLLEAVAATEEATQRSLAAELGIALGLVNSYLKRCVKKGLIKVRQVPRRRYAYYLTPHGFSEKSRLTAEYLSSSFAFFRKARAQCSAILQSAQRRGMRKVALVGASELAEVCALSALETAVEVIGVVDATHPAAEFTGLKVYRDFAELGDLAEGLVVTAMVDPRRACEAAVASHGEERVFLPELIERAAKTPPLRIIPEPETGGA
ncbi:MAG TPA: winged helix-turn-helix transcriptional regulator [Hyphomicrobiales bacterium]|nr:winged helix-turn-helix transcriptional regulator [Hyphomicrobiales bacterium]